MTDLELLSLVQRVDDARKGERGAEGVGIREIRSVSPTELVITLTDGRTFQHRFPEPVNGETGAIGPAGPSGERGPAGARGPAGEAGRAGKDGADGADGSFVDTALVNTAGDLLIGLSDGNIVNAGRVVGPAGATGERGLTGIAGPAGLNGTNFIAGERPPVDSEDGEDGDMYLDLSSPQKDVFGPKRGGAWGPRRFFMQAPQPPTNQPARSGLGGGSGGGKDTGIQPPFDIRLPAGVEIEIGRVLGDVAYIEYHVADEALLSQWSAGTFNTATTELADDAVFTVAAELFGTGGPFDINWRVDRVGENLIVLATAPVDGRIKGRIRSVTV